MISIVLTIHNKEFLVRRCIDSIFKNSKMTNHLIVVLDGCTDGSPQIVKEMAVKSPFEISILETADVFEVRSNNAGLKASSEEYVILLQDDMVVAKNAHNNYLTGQKPGSSQDLISHGEITEAIRDSRSHIQIRDTVNRGPLALRGDVVRELGYLDEEYAPYIWDDHDLCYRARNRGWICGSYNVKFISEKDWGTTRSKNRDLHASSNLKNQRIFYERHFERLKIPNKEAYSREVHDTK